MSSIAASPLSRFSVDLRAGISAAVIGLPQEINYGILAVAPLGLAFAGHGIAAALYGSALAVLVALALGAGRGRIVGPRPTLSILLASFYAALLALPGTNTTTVLMFAAIAVGLAGLVLVAAARAGLGQLIKYVPMPVLSGFTGGVAATLIISSLPMALGAGLHPGSLAAWINQAHPAAILVTVITIWFSVRPLTLPVLRQVPAVLQALIFAWLTHRLLIWAGLPAGPDLGALVTRLPGPDTLLGSLALPAFSIDHLAIALKFGVALAVAAALETLATAAAIDAQLGEKSSGDQELQRLGFTLICLSPLGMPVAGSLGRSTALLAAGARSRWAQACYALCLLGVTALCYALISHLPQAAIAGVLMVVARNMVGQSLHQAVAQVADARDRAERQRATADLAVMLLVVSVTVADSFVTGLAAGVVSAMALFIRDQSLSVVRRIQFGNRCHSLRLRSPEARAIQLQHGREIAIVEADGVLFFGSAEHLARQIEELVAETREIIIDLRRVSDIDATAGRVLEQTARRLAARDCSLILSHLGPGRKMYGALVNRGFTAAVPSHLWFADLDHALEYAEDRLLARHGCRQDGGLALPLARSDLATAFRPEDLARLETYLQPLRLPEGRTLFRQGESGSSLFVVTQGAISIRLAQAGERGKRLVAFGPGSVLGEMALITGAPRSADAVADEDSKLLELDRQGFQRLQQEHPTIAVALLQAVAGVLADRLRNTTLQLRELDQE